MSPRGTRGWASHFRLNGQDPASAMDLVNTVMVSGFEHHFPLAMGDLSESVLEFAAWMSITPLEKVPYRNYLQTRSW